MIIAPIKPRIEEGLLPFKTRYNPLPPHSPSSIALTSMILTILACRGRGRVINYCPVYKQLVQQTRRQPTSTRKFATVTARDVAHKEDPCTNDPCNSGGGGGGGGGFPPKCCRAILSHLHLMHNNSEYIQRYIERTIKFPLPSFYAVLSWWLIFVIILYIYKWCNNVVITLFYAWYCYL